LFFSLLLISIQFLNQFAIMNDCYKRDPILYLKKPLRETIFYEKSLRKLIGQCLSNLEGVVESLSNLYILKIYKPDELNSCLIMRTRGIAPRDVDKYMCCCSVKMLLEVE